MIEVSISVRTYHTSGSTFESTKVLSYFRTSVRSEGIIRSEWECQSAFGLKAHTCSVRVRVAIDYFYPDFLHSSATASQLLAHICKSPSWRSVGNFTLLISYYFSWIFTVNEWQLLGCDQPKFCLSAAPGFRWTAVIVHSHAHTIMCHIPWIY